MEEFYDRKRETCTIKENKNRETSKHSKRMSIHRLIHQVLVAFVASCLIRKEGSSPKVIAEKLAPRVGAEADGIHYLRVVQDITTACMDFPINADLRPALPQYFESTENCVKTGKETITTARSIILQIILGKD